MIIENNHFFVPGYTEDLIVENYYPSFAYCIRFDHHFYLLECILLLFSHLKTYGNQLCDLDHH